MKTLFCTALNIYKYVENDTLKIIQRRVVSYGGSSLELTYVFIYAI